VHFMSKIYTQRKVSRSYWGEETAAVLLDWLNRPNRPRNDPVQRLVDMQIKTDPSNPDPRWKMVAFVNRTVRQWNLHLVPVASVAPDGWTADWRHNPTRNAHPLQLLAFVKALHLAEQRVFGRVRKCARPGCSKYYFARFVHQDFCSGKCQRLDLRSTQEWRAKRAEYMRRLRHDAKQRVIRGLESTKRKVKR